MTRRILIYAAVAQDGVLANKVLRSVGIASCLCTSMESLIAELAEGAGALLIVEEVVAGHAMLPLRRYVEAQAAWSDLPIIVLTTRGSDSLLAQRAVELLGNVTLLERPVRTIALISAARSALRARERQYQVRVADQRKDEFLAMLAHELRNPLTPIGNSMAIISRLQPTPQVQTLAGIVDRQVRHLTRLVDDLLDVARITTGKIVLQMRPTTIRSVITHALEISSTSISDKEHHLELVQPEVDHEIVVDHARIVQTLANLLVNAAKFTPRGGHIQLSVDVQGDTVHFRVKDDGRGLAAESQATIFEMFAQARAPGEPTNGLGIGLNLAQRFAQMHGGEVRVHSDGQDKGSEFVLHLPVVKGLKTLDVPAPVAPPAAGHGPIRVLVVDDNIDAAQTLGALLELEGFSVSIAYDGVEAVELTRREPPAVVLMDIGMPRMDGYEAARHIRAQSEGNIKLIALTGWGQALDRQAAQEAGFDAHLVKPVDLQALLKCLVPA